MKVVLTSHGSTGDIYPMIGLGLALQQAGHEVRFATSPPFEEDIRCAGLEYVKIPPRWGAEELAYWMGRMQDLSNPLSQLREMYRAAAPHIGELAEALDGAMEDADILISSYFFPMNRAIAERRNVRFATYAFAHNTVPSRFYPPDGFPRLRKFPKWVQQRWNRSLWRVANLAVDFVVNRTISRQLKSSGLPEIKDFFSKPADLVLVAVSPGLMKPRCRLNQRFKFVGYCRWQARRAPQLEEEVEAFTQGEAVPVLSFGSMVYRDPDAWMERLAKAWPTDRKLIVQSGWAKFEAVQGCPNIKVIGAACHDWLFSLASVVIHHGGAGTTASVLYAGKPHVVVPHIGDQTFFSHEVRRLGCGVKLGKGRWPERLANTTRKVESDNRFARRAAEAQRTLRSERGPEAAVAAIEAYVADKGPLRVG